MPQNLQETPSSSSDEVMSLEEGHDAEIPEVCVKCERPLKESSRSETSSASSRAGSMEVIPLTYRTTPGQVPTGEAQRLEPAPNALLCVRRGGGR